MKVFVKSTSLVCGAKNRSVRSLLAVCSSSSFMGERVSEDVVWFGLVW